MSGGLQLETEYVRDIFAFAALSEGYVTSLIDGERAFDEWLLRFKEDSYSDGFFDGRAEGYGDGNDPEWQNEYAEGVEERSGQ